MLIHSLIIVAAPIPIRIPTVLRSALEACLGNARDVAAEASIIFQGIPRNWVVVLTHTEESAELITAYATLPLILSIIKRWNRNDLVSVCAVNRGAVNLVAADERSCFPIHYVCHDCSHC